MASFRCRSCLAAPSLLFFALAFACAWRSAHAPPPVSTGVLWNFYSVLQQSIGVFPDPKSKNPSNNTLYVVNEAFDHCIHIASDDNGSGQLVNHARCHYSSPPNSRQAFWLLHVGEGYLTFSRDGATGVGAGYGRGSLLYTGDWVKSPSHQWALIAHGDVISFVNRDSAFCLAASSPDVLTVATCVHTDPLQRWRFCDKTGALCWPSPKPPPIMGPNAQDPNDLQGPQQGNPYYRQRQ